MNPKDTNLVISSDDIQFISDKNHIKRKLMLLDTISNRLISLNDQLKDQSRNWKLAAQYLTTAGKISKGENHNGYPYLVLDYPRNFQQSNIFAFRNLFWWGNFYSSTLHICGIEQKRLAERILSKKEILIDNRFMINRIGSKWDNTIDSYMNIANVENFEDYIIDQVEKGNSIRFMRILDLNNINQLESFTLTNSEILFS